MRGQKRPLADRTRALGIAVVNGVAAASRETGIPEETIYGWTSSPQFAELKARTKDEVSEEWWAIVQRGFRRVGELLETTPDLQKVAVATAIVADKMLLIRGDATTRSESRDLTGTFDDDELDSLRRAIQWSADHPEVNASETAVEPAGAVGATSSTG